MASQLPNEHFDVTFASHPRFASLFGTPNWRSSTLDSISPERFLGALAAGKPVYDVETLNRYVEEDSRIISETKPDIVVGDFRISLSVSARKAGVPYVNISNGYWSPYARPSWIAPTLPWTAYVGTELTNRLFRLFRPLAFAAHARPLNVVRERHALPRLPADVRYAYTDGELTLYADLAELIPLSNAPPSHQHLGPVDWSPALELPRWWPELPDGRSIIYVNLGSSGRSDLIPRIVAALADQLSPTLIATAGHPLELAKTPNVYVEPYLDGAQAARRASVVICNGGSPAAQQALINGAPVLGLPSNLDQFLNMSYVERAGAGILCRADTAVVPAIRHAVRRLVDEPAFRAKATSIAQRADVSLTHRRFRCALESLLPA